MSNKFLILNTLVICKLLLSCGADFAIAQVTPMTKNLSSEKTKTDSLQPALSTRYCVTVASKLNVRQQPSAQSKAVGALSNGDFVEVYAIKDGWAEIAYNGNRAYISARYIKKAPLPEETAQNTSLEESQAPDTVSPVATEKTEPIEKKTTKISFNKWWEQLNSSTTSENKFIDDWYLVANLSAGISNLHSPDAYSSGSIGMLAEAGVRFHPYFLPQKMYFETSTGFALLGNDQYTLPYFYLNILSAGVQYNLFNITLHSQFGFSLMLGGEDLYVSTMDFHRTYPANPGIAFTIRETVELTRHWDLGILYLQGLNNVYSNLPIRLYHRSIQLSATYKLDTK